MGLHVILLETVMILQEQQKYYFVTILRQKSNFRFEVVLVFVYNLNLSNLLILEQNLAFTIVDLV